MQHVNCRFICGKVFEMLLEVGYDLSDLTDDDGKYEHDLMVNALDELRFARKEVIVTVSENRRTA
jgi:hypothetical protein